MNENERRFSRRYRGWIESFVLPADQAQRLWLQISEQLARSRKQDARTQPLRLMQGFPLILQEPKKHTSAAAQKRRDKA